MSAIRLLIADDQIHYCNSLANVIKKRGKGIQVVGTAHNGLDVLKQIDDCKPSIILMDVRMPKMDGVECTQIICRNYPDIKIVMFSTFDDDECIFKAIDNGAIGYLLKSIPPNELITSIYAVNGGVFQMSPSIAQKLVQKQSREQAASVSRNQKKPSWFISLKRREREILYFLSQGYTNKEIGERLFLSEQTVKNYTSHIYEIMGVENRSSAQQLIFSAELF